MTRQQVRDVAAERVGLETRVQLKRGLLFLKERSQLVTRAPAEKRGSFTYHLNGEQPEKGLGPAPKLSRATKKRMAILRKKKARQRR